jgi:hypothetical protein
MIKILLRNATLVVGFIASSQALKAQQADFDEVGKQMAIMLQNSHYAGIRFDAQLSRRFFEVAGFSEGIFHSTRCGCFRGKLCRAFAHAFAPRKKHATSGRDL